MKKRRRVLLLRILRFFSRYHRLDRGFYNFQFLFPDKLNGESTCRKQIDVMLNSMDEKELTVMKYTAEGLQKARETEDV